MTQSKLNGSVDRLATALRDVIREGAAEAVAPLHKDMKDIKADIAQLKNNDRYHKKSIIDLRKSIADLGKKVDGVKTNVDNAGV